MSERAKLRAAPVRSWAVAVFITVSSIITVTVCPCLFSERCARAVERPLLVLTALGMHAPKKIFLMQKEKNP